MSAAKLLLKIRRHAQSPYNTALLIILISFGLLNNVASEIAPKADDDPLPLPDKLHTESIALNSINDMVGKINSNGGSDVSTKQPILKSNLGFIHAFIASISVILVSELGDKTFFIAAIMAMRHPRLTVFAGAIGALALMTVLSAVFGMAATVIPRIYTYYISTALFAIFGLKMLKDGYYMPPNGGQEELEEVQTDLRRREDELERDSTTTAMVQDPESGVMRRMPRRSPYYLTLRILLQAFTMTFLAEWGDRSQLATIILAARENIYGIIVGGTMGHVICTGLAVIGGRCIAQRISVRTVTIVGGVVFLLFAISALFIDPDDD